MDWWLCQIGSREVASTKVLGPPAYLPWDKGKCQANLNTIVEQPYGLKGE